MKKVLLMLMVFFTILSCGNKNNNSKNGKTFTMNLSGEPASIDPAISTDSIGGTVDELIVEGLLRRTPDGAPQPGLAEKYEVNTDGTIWTFHLRDGIKWSNGDPITAGDFKAAWLRVLNPDTASEYAYMLYPIKNAEEYNSGKAKAEDVAINVIDDKTIEVTLGTPTPYFADLVTFKTYAPLNQKLFAEFGEKYFTEAETTVSAGPYVLKKWIHDSEMVFEKNPNYWDKDSYKVDTIVYKLITDNAGALQAFKNGEVDLTRITAEQAKEFKDDPRLVKIVTGSVWYLLVNHNNKVLKNVKIRQALLLALDREEMNKTVSNGNDTIPKTFVPANVGIRGLTKDNFSDEVKSQIPSYDPEKAKKLLAEGMKELGITEFPKLEVIFNDSGSNKATTEFIQEAWRKNLGINLELSAMTFPERLSRMKENNFDLAFAGWSGDFHDPITYLDLYASNSGNNTGKYKNARYDELVDIVKSTADNKVRFNAMYEIEKIIAEELPILPLTVSRRNFLIDPKVKGIKLTSIGGEYYFKDLDIENK